MRKLILAAGVLFASILGASSQSASSATGVLKGRVIESYEHARVGYAYVLVHRRGVLDQKVDADAQGEFKVELVPGVYDVFVSSSGFEPACRKIEIRVGKTSVYNVQLRANTLGMNED